MAKGEGGTSPRIRLFTEDDILPAIALWRATEHIGLSAADEPPALAGFLARNPGLSFVAVDSGALAGAVLCGHDGRRGYIHHLAVAPGRRRRHLGRLLLHHSLAALRDAGISKCHAFVFHSNPHAELFWKPEGWARREDLLVYSRNIPHEP
jgi:ribosomal protein S18 acetylase RimI-like enzyme